MKNKPIYLYVDGGSDCVSSYVSKTPPNEDQIQSYGCGELLVFKLFNGKVYEPDFFEKEGNEVKS